MARTMRCHYEVLGIERTVEGKDIKVAYFKLAREWHPDKNIGNETEAEIKFKEISEAYEVLSDPQERAWYDSHREQILKGGDGTDDGGGSAINVWPFLSKSCFSGFGDKEGGFFKVYATLFKSINDEECQHAVDAGKTNPIALPPFGHSTTEWADVNRFYIVWLDFSTQSTFSWCDKYKPSDAPSRQVRRLIEKENKKERDKIKKSFNEVIRKLASFVHNLDPRVKAAALVQKIKEKEKLEREAKEKIEKAERTKKLKAEYAKARALEAQENGEEESEESSSTEEEVEEFYCAPCKRKFRSTGQMKNHVESKKHKQIVASLKKQLLFEDDIEEDLQKQEEEIQQQNSQSGEEEKNTENSKENEETENIEVPSEVPLETEAPVETEVSVETEVPVESEVLGEKEPEDDEDSFVEVDDEQMGAKLKTVLSPEVGASSSSDESSEEGLFPMARAQQKKKQQLGGGRAKPAKVVDLRKELGIVDPESSSSNEEVQAVAAPKKKRRRAVKKQVGGTTPIGEPSGDVANEKKGEQHKCGKCNANFNTRNQLFNHIKKTGHAQPK